MATCYHSSTPSFLSSLESFMADYLGGREESNALWDKVMSDTKVESLKYQGLLTIGTARVKDLLHLITDCIRKASKDNLEMEKIFDLCIIAINILISLNPENENFFEEFLEKILLETKLIFRFISPEKILKCNDCSIVSKVDHFMDIFGDFLARTVLSETMIFLSISTFSIMLYTKFPSNIQIRSMNILLSLARKYPSLIEFIFSEITKSIEFLNPKKSKFRLTKNENSIQVLSALVMQLIQNISHSQTVNNTEKHKTKLRDTFENIVEVCLSFVSNIMDQCCQSSLSAKYLAFLELFVQDLIYCLYEPEWPSAETLLQIICSLLTQNITNYSPDVQISAVKILGNVVSNNRVTISEKHTFSSIFPQLQSKSMIDLQTNNEICRRCEVCEIHGYIESLAYCFFCYHFELLRSILKMKAKLSDKEGKALIYKFVFNYNSEENNCSIHSSENNFEQLKISFKNKAVLTPLQKILLIPNSFLCLNRDWTIVLKKYLAYEDDLDKFTTKLLDRIVHLFYAVELPSVRVACTKSLLTIIKADCNVLNSPKFKKVIAEILTDKSANVRQTAVEFFLHIINDQNLIHSYYPLLVEKLNDSSPAVQNRLMKLILHIAKQYPSFSKFPNLLELLISRSNHDLFLKQQKTVKDIFYSLWFSNLSTREAIKQSTNLLLFSLPHFPTDSWLLELLISWKQNETESENTEFNSSLSILCEQLVENIIDIEEEKQNNSNLGIHIYAKLLPYIKLLDIFSQFSPLAIGKRLITLSHYLKPEIPPSRESSEFHSYILNIIDRSISFYLQSTRITEFEALLKLYLNTTTSMKILEASVKCLVSLLNLQNEYRSLRELIVNICNDLEENIGHDINPSTLRHLYSLSLIVRYYPEGAQIRDLIDRIVLLLRRYRNFPNNAVKEKCIQSFGQIILKFPSVMIPNADFISSSLTDQSYIVKTSILKVLLTFVEMESQLQHTSDHWVILFQEKLQLIVPLLLDSSFEVRNAALLFVNRVILNQLVHPSTYIEFIIPISANFTKTQQIAHQLLHEVNLKFSSSLSNSLRKGLENLFEHRAILLENHASSNMCSVLSNIYDVVSGKIAQKKILFSTLFDIIESIFSINNNNTQNSFEYCIDKLKFFCNALSLLPFKEYGDLQVIMILMDKILDANLGHAISKLHAHLGSNTSQTLSEVKNECFLNFLPISLLLIKKFLKQSYNFTPEKYGKEALHSAVKGKPISSCVFQSISHIFSITQNSYREHHIVLTTLRNEVHNDVVSIISPKRKREKAPLFPAVQPDFVKKQKVIQNQ